MHNKKIKGSIAGLALAAVLVGGTFAWLTAEDSIDNAFSTGDNQAEVEIWEDFDDTNAGKVVPGVAVDKKVKVQNLSTVQSFIRAKLEVTVQSDQESITEDDIILNYSDDVITKDKINKPISEYSEKWVEGNDGWFYYIGKVDTEDFTKSDLLSSVTLSGEVGDVGTVKFNVNVTAENIQTDPSDAVDTWKNEETATNNTSIISALKVTTGVGSDNAGTGYEETE